MDMANSNKKDKQSTKHYAENNLLDNNIPPRSLSWLDIGNWMKIVRVKLALRASTPFLVK
jgi:hypothetical protein